MIDELVKTCARHEELPPSGDAPARYCYLSCVSGHHCDLDSPDIECDGCGGAQWEFQAVEGGVPVELAPGLTVVTVLAFDGGSYVELGSMLAGGQLFVDIPDACRTDIGAASCSATITKLALRSLGDLDLGDEVISNVRLHNAQPFNETFSIDQGAGALTIPPPMRFGLTGDLASAPYSYMDLEPRSNIATIWDWTARSMWMSTVLQTEDESIRIIVEGYGRFDSLPPHVVATATPSTVECGRRVTLSAAASTDPDGPADLKSVSWTSQWPEHVWQAEGTAVNVYPPLGDTRFYATLHDATGITDSTHVDVRVEDTIPPTLDVEPEVFVEGCGPKRVSLIPRDVEDSCDTEPATEIRIVAINGVAANILYTPTYPFRPGETTVRYRVTDDAGNEALGFQTVVVERASSCCPAGSLLVNGNNANNTLFASDAQPSCLVGRDGVDNLVGGTRFDTLLGGRGIDQLQNVDRTSGNFMWGGIGNDALRSSGPGDVLMGGPGDDLILYSGSTTAKLRGGAGKDTITSAAGVQLATFILGAACEARPGEKWTSNGPTRVESPISLAQIQALGVTLQLHPPVQFVQTGALADAECQ